MEENKIINEEEIVAEVEDVIAEAAPVEAAPEEAAPEEAAPEEAEKETVEDALDELQKAAETTVEELKSAAGLHWHVESSSLSHLGIPFIYKVGF